MECGELSPVHYVFRRLRMLNVISQNAEFSVVTPGTSCFHKSHLRSESLGCSASLIMSDYCFHHCKHNPLNHFHSLEMLVSKSHINSAIVLIFII